jgi:RNA polymerase sigma factor (TIGR02999 family)
VQPMTHELTELLRAWSNGDQGALEKLTPVVYRELHRLARRCMADERRDHTLQATALVNEAYLRLINWKEVQWQNRAHFFSLAARLMRHILIDFARAKRYAKRGSGQPPVALEEASVTFPDGGPDLIVLDLALSRLSTIDPRKAQIVELRFFGGLNVNETAQVLKISRDTVMRDWKLARIWLLRELSGEGNDT